MRVFICFISAILVSFQAIASGSFTESSINKKRGYIETVVNIDIYEVHISAPPGVNVGNLLPDQHSSPRTPRDLYAEIEARRLKQYQNYDLGIAIGPISGADGDAVKASLEPKLVPYKLSGEVFQDGFVLAKDQMSTSGPASAFGNNANGVVSFVTVSAGTTQLDLMEGGGTYAFKTLTNKGYTSTSFSVGYPGRYGARITCVTRTKCKGVFSNVFLN